MVEVLQWINFLQASGSLLEDSHYSKCFDVSGRRTDDQSCMIKLIFLEFKIASLFFQNKNVGKDIWNQIPQANSTAKLTLGK